MLNQEVEITCVNMAKLISLPLINNLTRQTFYADSLLSYLDITKLIGSKIDAFYQFLASAGMISDAQ